MKLARLILLLLILRKLAQILRKLAQIERCLMLTMGVHIQTHNALHTIADRFTMGPRASQPQSQPQNPDNPDAGPARKDSMPDD